MKKINISVFLGAILALPIIHYLDNDPDHPLDMGAIALILFLTIGMAGLISKLFFKQGKPNEQE